MRQNITPERQTGSSAEKGCRTDDSLPENGIIKPEQTKLTIGNGKHILQHQSAKHSEEQNWLRRLYKCNITDVTALADTLAQTQALEFLKLLDLRYNKIKDQTKLHEVLKSSKCKLRLQTQGFWRSLTSALRDVQASSDEEDGDTSFKNGIWINVLNHKVS
ncbi:hypothetical protein E1301_Tti021154 [Triplophysa tibetana]|uniref:Uncharacterized protein n=1 Tax=Triplophysa tibetana TaxID=1572043 RepID=A0A5A9NS37_9TELE|nr:hypothetical protein E1301_Tti021154 [Triplophysa tibetana]